MTNIDSCMTSIEDSSCTDSYGKTDNYVSNKGSSASLIGWVQQLSKKRYPLNLFILTVSGKPSIVQCTLGTTALTFGDVATEDASGTRLTTDSCAVAKNYEKVSDVDNDVLIPDLECW